MDELRHRAPRIEAALDLILSASAPADERPSPPRLAAAMRHGVLNGGKRLRPFLILESAALFGVEEKTAMPVACALELVHCYSLIHDDLPAMDDDDLRRGKPTVHIAFDEATAILAGDALLTLAFDIVGDTVGLDASVRIDLTRLLARAAGRGGMIGGQMLDMEAENSVPGIDDVMRLQAMKTGALIKFAAEAGALIGKAKPDERQALIAYGEHLGASFQLADDLLDVTASSETMGKTTGKDDARGKGTLVALLGDTAARQRLAELTDAAKASLSEFGAKADTLKALADFAAERKS